MGEVFRGAEGEGEAGALHEGQGAARERRGPGKPILRLGEKGDFWKRSWGSSGMPQPLGASWVVRMKTQSGSRFSSLEKPGVGGALGRVQHHGWRMVEVSWWVRGSLGPGQLPPAPRHWPPLLLRPTSQEHPPRLQASFSQGGALCGATHTLSLSSSDQQLVIRRLVMNRVPGL